MYIFGVYVLNLRGTILAWKLALKSICPPVIQCSYGKSQFLTGKSSYIIHK